MSDQEVAFRVSTGLKDIIGKDLITDDFIAIFELVKNSYDAQAKNVTITFEEDKIVIADDGKGMSLEDIEKKWLFLAFSAKKNNTEDIDEKRESYRDKIEARRFYAGAKGIGRFSCDRLGSHLILTTRKKETNDIEQIDVDWKKFEENQYEEFISIKLPHRTLKQYDIKFPYGSANGTLLEIKNLSSVWNRDKIKNLKHSLEKLINPFSETNDFNIEIISDKYLPFDLKKIDENLKPVIDRDLINGPVKNSILDILNLKTTQIDIEIDTQFIHTKLSDRGTLIYHIKEPNFYNLIDNLKVNLYFLNRSGKINFKRRMGIEPKNYGSVFLFKNGFRVQPYGKTGDDSWGLDFRSQQGYNRFLSSRELFGRVDIITENVLEFKEVSSRDGGMVETIGYGQLMDVFKEKGLKRLERYVVGVLWGEGFLKNKYFTSENEGKKFRKMLLDSDKDSDDYSNAVSNIGSKIDFIRLIRSLADDRNVEILEFNAELVDLVNDKLEDIQPKFLKDLEKIAENTGNEDLKEKILFTEQNFIALQIEKEAAEKRAYEEEIKRKEEEDRRKIAELEKLRAEKLAKEAEEKKQRAEFEAEKAKNARLQAELDKRNAKEAQRKAEEAQRKAEFESAKKTEQLAIRDSIDSQDIENVINLHHQVFVVSDTISTLLQEVNNRIGLDGEIDYIELSQFIDELTFENNKIEALSRFGMRAIFEDFNSINNNSIVDFIRDYVSKISNFFKTSKVNIFYESLDDSDCIVMFRPLDISIIIDNIINNSKKHKSTKLLIATKAVNNHFQIIFSDDGLGLNPNITDATQLFKKDFLQTKSSGLGLYHIDNIITDYGWKIEVNSKVEKGIQFIITI